MSNEVSELRAEIEQLKTQLEELKALNTRYANRWYRAYGEYLRDRLYEYRCSKDDVGYNQLYGAVRKIVLLRYYGVYKKSTLQMPGIEEDYIKMCNIVDEILPVKLGVSTANYPKG